MAYFLYYHAHDVDVSLRAYIYLFSTNYAFKYISDPWNHIDNQKVIKMILIKLELIKIKLNEDAEEERIQYNYEIIYSFQNMSIPFAIALVQ